MTAPTTAPPTPTPTPAAAEFYLDAGFEPSRRRRRPALFLSVGLALGAALMAVVLGLVLFGRSAPATPAPAGIPSAAADQPRRPVADQPRPPAAGQPPAAAVTPAAAATAPATPPTPTGAAPPAVMPPTNSATTSTGEVTGTKLRVLNSSRTAGLGNQSAKVLRDNGWAVAAVGNYSGRVPVTTVFFADGWETQARALADAFPSVQQVLPRRDDLPDGGLIVVVTRSLSRSDPSADQ